MVVAFLVVCVAHFLYLECLPKESFFCRSLFRRNDLLDPYYIKRWILGISRWKSSWFMRFYGEIL